MHKNLSTEHFEKMSFHDCTLYGFIWESNGDDWDSDLILFIDYIDEWLPDSKSSWPCKFAPATLIFKDVTNLNYGFDTGLGDCYQNIISNPKILGIKRTIQSKGKQLVHHDRDYSVWEIAFSQPEEGGLRFGATGFSLIVHEEPKVVPEEGEVLLKINQRIGLYYRDCIAAR